jgi:hypothetical protein
MKRVDGLTGRNFLIGILIAYFLTFFFSYFYFMTASTLITGNAVIATEKGDYQYMNDPALIQTLWILLILVLLFIFVYLIPKIMHRRQMKFMKIKVESYRPFRTQ